MRTLRFIMEGMFIKPDPNCDFSGLVPGSEGYLQAEFSLPPELQGYTLAAAFFSAMGVEYEPQPLVDGRCTIPAEALERRVFKVQLVGKKGGIKLRTNKIEVCQDGGKT